MKNKIGDIKMSEEKEEIPTLQERGLFMFGGDVDDDICNEFIEFVLVENFERRHEQLTMIVNSPGGYVSNGFSVIDIMIGSKIPIRTVGIGIIASMGLMIFITGARGHRILTPNTLIMSHQWEGGMVGKEHELVAGMKRNNLISDMVIRHYRKHTGLSIKKIRKYLLPPNDVYLNAKEARMLGLCDEIRMF